jgi:hypothetical protein
LEDGYSGKRALRSSELPRAQTSKKKLFPETCLIGPVQNFEIHHKVTFPRNIDSLRDFSSQNFNGTFNSSLAWVLGRLTFIL